MSRAGVETASQAERAPRSAAAAAQGSADVDTAATGAVIVSAADGSAVDIYNKAGKRVAQIGIVFPTGLALDAAGHLYVANTSYQSGPQGIPIYKNDDKTLLATLADPGYSIGVAVDRRTGLVAATNTTLANDPGNVTIYVKGATAPCATLSNPAFQSYDLDAYDSAGNLYLEGMTGSGAPLVGLITGECSATTINLLSTANSLTHVSGIQVTPAGDVALVDQTTIDTDRPPVNDALGAPIATTPLNGLKNPRQVAFNKAATAFYVTDAEFGGTFKFAYPAGGTALTFIKPQNTPVGVVLTPQARQ